MFLAIQKKMKKRRGMSALAEMLMACVLMIIVGLALIYNLREAPHSAKMAKMTSEMDAIAAACLNYESLNINGAVPASLSDLVTGLTAAQSLDGAAHNNFITASRGTTGSVLDPWGTAYGYSSTNRTITCTPKDPSGADLTQVVKRF